jgi:hypothetical protein
MPTSSRGARRRASLRAALPLLAAAAALPACRAAQAPVPGALAGATRLPVQGRQGWKIGQRLAFGPFTADSVDRSWTSGADFGYGPSGGPMNTRSRRDQRYAFVQREAGAAPVRAWCQARLRQRAVESRVVDVQLADESSLGCRLVPGADTLLAWTMTLSERRDEPLAGAIARAADPGRAVYRVRGVNRLEGAKLASSLTTGYELLQGDRPVGMVDVVGGGAVVLSPSLPDGARRVLATAASALLLLEDLRETTDDR